MDLGVNQYKDCFFYDLLHDVHLKQIIFKRNQEIIALNCNAIFCCDTDDVEPNLFTAIVDSCLVYDGKLVIDGKFRTSDPAMYVYSFI